MNSVAILCGGLATRLGSITQAVPKCLVPVAGKPFMFHQLDWLAGQGVRRVVLCTGKFADQVEAEVGHKYQTIQVVHSADGAKPLGTGGCLSKALPHLGKAFWVLNGDTWLDLELGKIKCQGQGTVVIRPSERNHGNVCCDQANVILDYIPGTTTANWLNFVDCGLGHFEASAFPPFGVFELGAVFRQLIKSRSLFGFKTDRDFYDMGTPEGLQKLEQKLKQ